MEVLYLGSQLAEQATRLFGEHSSNLAAVALALAVLLSFRTVLGFIFAAAAVTLKLLSVVLVGVLLLRYSAHAVERFDSTELRARARAGAVIAARVLQAELEELTVVLEQPQLEQPQPEQSQAGFFGEGYFAEDNSQ